LSGWLGLGLSLTVFAGARQADACSCNADGTFSAWPKDGARGVPLDTPILVGPGVIASLRVALISNAGYLNELTERRLPITGIGCSDGIVIMLPAGPLEPNTRYNLQTWSRDAIGVTEGEGGIFFTTGSAMREVPAPAIDVHLFAAKAGAMRLLEAFVETDADEPLLVRAQGEQAVNVDFFDNILRTTPL
jgi:hypothetical protein